MSSPMPPPMRLSSPRCEMSGSGYNHPLGQPIGQHRTGGGYMYTTQNNPVAQYRNHRLEPISVQASVPQRTPRQADGDARTTARSASPAPQQRAAQATQKKGGGLKNSPNVPPAVLLGLANAAAAVRELNWNKLYLALDVVIRYLMPCESFTLFLCEDRGKYLRRVNTYLEAFPPDRRGSALDAVSEETIEGSAAMNVEPYKLPSKSRYAPDWAMREANTLHPMPGMPTADDVAAGRLRCWSSEGLGSDDKFSDVVIEKVHNVVVWPIRFGTPDADSDDAFHDYSSVDSQNVGADETVFGVIKLVNRYADRATAKKLQFRRLQTGRRGKDDLRFRPFSEGDLRVLSGLSCLLRELYFAIDPMTFGPRVEPSLEFNPNASQEPLNGPSFQGRSVSTSMPSGSRMLESGPQAGSNVHGGGLFGVLGSAFAKSASQRRRAPELPDLVPKPTITVTSDSTESMRNAPGWIHKEWIEEDVEGISAERAKAGQRRIGGITLLATWRLREEAIVDPYCVICRFQIRIRRVSHVRPGQGLWRVLPSFFCISPDEGTQQYCAFLTEYLHYAEEYIVSVRAGSADRWSEWSEASDPIRFEARPLCPRDKRVPLEYDVIGPNEEGPVDPYSTHEHTIRFTWPAFVSFEPRTPLPVEYCVEAWQREDQLGAASPEQIHANAKESTPLFRSQRGIHDDLPGAGPEWMGARRIPISTMVSEAVADVKLVHSIDVRGSALVPGSFVYFGVRARYLSLPGSHDWSEAAIFAYKACFIADVTPSLPAPMPVCAEEFDSTVTLGKTRAALSGPDDVVVRWPFINPATFCPRTSTDADSWAKGSFIPDKLPKDFPLPFRLQYRTIGSGKWINGAALAWSVWREAESYEFVRRHVPDKLAAQLKAAKPASNGEYMRAASGHSDKVSAHISGDECVDPAADPLGLLTEHWALRITALSTETTEDSWPGLVQLRWTSCSIEGVVSAPSQVLCTKVSGPCKAPRVDHLVLNCSTRFGPNVPKVGSRDLMEVQELRHVARLTWVLDCRSHSFAFLRRFEIRYQEVPPGSDVINIPWRELPPIPLTDAVDLTEHVFENMATFSYDLASVPLFRNYRYTFSLRVQSNEHVSDWSKTSEILHVMLPEILPRKPGDTIPTPPSTSQHLHPAWSLESIRDADHIKTMQSESDREYTVADMERRRLAQREEDSLLDANDLMLAEVCCDMPTDSSTWQVKLMWHHFLHSENGLDKFPTLHTLPIEFQVSYYVLTQRPSASDPGAGGPSMSEEEIGGLLSMEKATVYYGRLCPDDDTELSRQRSSSVICLEGRIDPGEHPVVRSIPRHRLPPLRCDVRVFVACRCPVVTGPRWSRLALLVDVALPRQVSLPLPVPRQLGCVELQSRGLPIDFGSADASGRTPAEIPADGLWAVLAIPVFHTEFVEAAAKDDSDDKIGDLLDLNAMDTVGASTKTPRKIHPQAHYVLQFCVHDSPAAQHRSGAGTRPLVEESEWRTVRSVRCLIDAGEESVYLASGFDGLQAMDKHEGVQWVMFRLASRKQNHFSYSSAPVLVCIIPPPTNLKPSVRWVDSPSLHGACVRISAEAHGLSNFYQLRYRHSNADPSLDTSWTLCEVQDLQRASSAISSDSFFIDVVVPINSLQYHSEYCFAVRTFSPVRFSAWSEDSKPVRLSLEHHGMVPLTNETLEIKFLGLEERHNYRCPAVDITWPPLCFPEGVWGPDSVSPTPELTIEYRVRLRRRVDMHNSRVALGAVVEEIASEHRPHTGDGDGGYKRDVLMLSPSPDTGVRDIANRGYFDKHQGDCTRNPHFRDEYTPWQTIAIVPAKAVGEDAIAKCACAIVCLLDGCDYEVAIDWRWRRLGDPFWMPAYDPVRFKTQLPVPSPPYPLQLTLPPEVWDADFDLREKMGDGRALLIQWPFAQPPTSEIIVAPLGRNITKEAVLDPLNHGDYAVQCRPAAHLGGDWITCESNFLLIHGKPVCLISRTPSVGQGTGYSTLSIGDGEPRPVGTPDPKQGAIGEDELEFRIVRRGDCEVSIGIPCPVAPPPAPEALRCRLKMLAPHSTLVVSARFQGVPTRGIGSAPRSYQIRIDDLQAGDSRTLQPIPLNLERFPEAYDGIRSHHTFLGEAQAPMDAGECGDLFVLARSGGDALRRLMKPLEYEHLLSSPDICFGKRYRIMVRWLSSFRVSDWSSPADITIKLEAPTATINSKSADDEPTLDIKALKPLLLPRGACDAMDDQGKPCQDFEPPAVADRVQLSWAPFQLSLWGGGKMEYEIQRQCMLWDRREPQGETATDVDTTSWEKAGSVLTDIEDASGKGVDAPSNCVCGNVFKHDSKFCRKCGRSRWSNSVVDLNINYDGTEKEQLAATKVQSIYRRNSTRKQVGDMRHGKIGRAKTSATLQAPQLAALSDQRQITFVVEELQPSAWYRFQVRARLHFHANSGFPEEWSEYLVSEWHRSMPAVPPPFAPEEASCPVDPPPLALRHDGTTLLRFPYIPIRETTRPLNASPLPAPYSLQYRGAEEAEDQPWYNVECEPLIDDNDEYFIVSDFRLGAHLAHGVIFRLWRCRPHEDRDPVNDPHHVDDDLRIRYCTSLMSQASPPIRVAPPHFADILTATIVLGPPVDADTSVQADEHDGLTDSEASDEELKAKESLDVVQGQQAHAYKPKLNYLPQPLLLRLNWGVTIPANRELLPIRLCQVRYRTCVGWDREEKEDQEGLMEEEEEEADEKDVKGVMTMTTLNSNFGSDPWDEMEPFEHLFSAENDKLAYEIPLVQPRFVMGRDYEVSVRVGTKLRWGTWSSPVSFSLAVGPPQPPAPPPAGDGRIDAEMKTLQDGTVFFKLTWPSFKPHPLCTQVDYRIRMIRVTRYKYKIRLSKAMLARSEEAFKAQQNMHVVGFVRRPVPRPAGPIDEDWEPPQEMLEFTHTVAASPECGYRFMIDARHERCSELSLASEVVEGHHWSPMIFSQELVTPPHTKHWFIPSQVPLEASPMQGHVDRFRAIYPISISELTCERIGLSKLYEDSIVMFAPWRSSKEASQWPHRIEYSPYIPKANAARHPIPGDGKEDNVDWSVPEDVEYHIEDREQDSTADAAPFVVVKGFDFSKWEILQAKLGVQKHLMDEHLGKFVRMRVVREGGPEGLQYFSVPSPPMRLSMPPLRLAPSVAIWTANAQFKVILWWPCVTALAGEEDKNISMAGQLHQIRMRRPLYDLDGGWIETPVRATPVPVMMPPNRNTTQAELVAFDWCGLADDSTMPDTLMMRAPPKEPRGPMPDPSILTYDFSVRISDGYRWSDWSPASECLNFALSPAIVPDTPVDIDKMQERLAPTEDTVVPVEPLKNIQTEQDLSRHIELTDDDEFVPPQWVSISHPPKPETAGQSRTMLDITADARRSQFIATWPVLPPQAYCQPDPESVECVEELLATGLIPEYCPPAVLYRLNVWLLASAEDAAPMTDLPDGLPRYQASVSSDDDEHSEAVLYRQYDLPPSSFPEPDEDNNLAEPELISFPLPYLLPDRVFFCTVEGRFQTLHAVEWWTPLMCSGHLTTPRLPPPAPPLPLPLAELPTPEYRKLLERAALGSSAIAAVKWPWIIESGCAEALRNAMYSLEFCAADLRPGLRDPTAKAGIESDTVESRPMGPWREAQALQLCFANFAKGLVLEELSSKEQNEAHWTPILVASGLHPMTADARQKFEDLGQAGEGDANWRLPSQEASFVHLRWRYRARAEDFATLPTPLHFSAASNSVRTRIVNPLAPPIWQLDRQQRRINAWIKWVAWEGATRHQLAFRILAKPKAKSGGHKLSRGGGVRREPTSPQSSDSESTRAASSKLGASTSTQKNNPQNEKGLQPATGWIELPPVTDGIERHPISVEGKPVHDASTDSTEGASEEHMLVEYMRKLTPLEWNGILFRRYKDQPEYYSGGQSSSADLFSEGDDTAGSLSAWGSSRPGSSRPSRLSRAGSSRSRSVSSADSSPNESPTTPRSRSRQSSVHSHRMSRVSLHSEKIEVSLADESSSRPSQVGSKQFSKVRIAKADLGNGNPSFRMQWGMLVEWRVRVSDGLLWSQWSPASQAGGLVPPIPTFSTPVQVDFSRREPTNARIAWGACTLPAELAHLEKTIEYVVYVTSDETSARNVLQAGQGTFSVEKLHRKGLQLSDGSCGVLEHYIGDDYVEKKEFDMDTLFTGSSERRVVGKFPQSHAKWINFRNKDGEEAKAVSGFELVVSGLKPLSVHRFSVRVRCATTGLDELDWQSLKSDTTHPLRWSDPAHAQPILTPKHPPPLLVPEPIEIPDGRFARFRHTPCVLVKCPVFKKFHPDDFDKQHPVVVDVREAGSTDEDFKPVPVENSLSCELDSHGPCRLVFNLPYPRVEIRARNTVMNDISAACPPTFAVAPLPLETQQGPSAELTVTETGDLFVTLTWTTRCLPSQQPELMQFGLKRHGVDAPSVDLVAIAVTPDVLLEEVPPNAVLAAGEEYDKRAAEAISVLPPPHVLSEPQCPFICRRCLLPLDKKKVPAPDALGVRGQARLENVPSALADGVINRSEIPEYCGWLEDLKLLRVPHRAELNEREQKLDREEGTQPPARIQKCPPVCGCRDVVIQKALPVDGTVLSYGTTYRFRVRMRDALTWSEFTAFSPPVHVSVAPPRIPTQLKDPQSPAPPPTVEVRLVRCTSDADQLTRNLGGAAATADVRLELRWPRFEGCVNEVEYRVFMWTLSPEQRRRAATGGGGRRSTTGLPPIVGTQTVVTEFVQPTLPEAPSSQPVNKEKSAKLNAADETNAQPLAVVRPRAVGSRAEGEVAVQHGADAPQLVAHIRPFEPPPRAGATRRASPQKVVAGLPSEGIVSGPPSVEIHAAPLPKGYGYVFAVESKHCRGACGNISEWSIPLFSKLVQFESNPRHLSLEVEGRFGSLLFKGTAMTCAKPLKEQVMLDAAAVSFVDEHRELPKAMPLLPEKDAWPLNCAPATGKYIVRQRGRHDPARADGPQEEPLQDGLDVGTVSSLQPAVAMLERQAASNAETRHLHNDAVREI